MTAPFLKERFGWVESDICWWCGISRQTREHLFTECVTWREGIKTLWREVGRAGGKKAGEGRLGKGRKGFGYRIRSGAGPGNTTVRELLSEERYVGVVLDFLRATKVVAVREGVIVR